MSMRKKLIAVILILIVSICIATFIIGIKNYNYYNTLEEEAITYNIKYRKHNLIVTTKEIKEVEDGISEEKTNIAAEADKKAEEERLAAEEARKAEEERIAAEEAKKAEEERIAAEESQKTNATENGDMDNCDPFYVDDILLVNKNHCLPPSYNPGGLTPETEFALNSMIADASSEGIDLVMVSGYRSFEYQIEVFNYWVNTLGYDEATQVSAIPGYSEHQTGLAVDVGAANGVCELQTCFESTQEGQWVKDNAHEYGFIIRYPYGKEDITGYSYEPWHLRYVGVDVATYIYENNLTLEEYLGTY